jgi:hypothetical protein
MKMHRAAYLAGDPRRILSLYDVFEDMHSASKNGMLHGTSVFLHHHKALMWLYESALIYIALTDGPTMNPPITPEQACNIQQPYWEWELGYNDIARNWGNIQNTDVFQYPDLFGDMTPGDNGYVDQGYFAYTTAFDAPENICVGSLCDRKLKRVFNSNILTGINATRMKDDIVNNPTFERFIPFLHGGFHNPIHNFVGGAMGFTATTALDPIFYMHHTNIDRFWHLWADCHDFDSVDASQISDQGLHYKDMNPVPSSATIKRDSTTGIAYTVRLDDTLNFYLTSSTATFLPMNLWPTVRDLWTMGTAAQSGWGGIYYRYGPDKMARALTAQGRCGNWAWVNQ